MPPTNKIEATLAIKPDTSAATRALQELVDLAKKLGIETKNSGDQMKRMGGGSPGGGGSGGNPWAWVNLQAKSQLIGDVMDKLTTSLKIFGDSTMSVNQRLVRIGFSLAESIPVYGAAIRAGRELAEEIKYGAGMRSIERTQERVGSELGIMSINNRRDQRLDGLNDQFMNARFNQMGTSAFPSRVQGFNFGGISTGLGGTADALARNFGGIGQNFANMGLGLSEAIKPDSVRAAEADLRRARQRQFSTQAQFNRLEGIRPDLEAQERRARDVPLGYSPAGGGSGLRSTDINPFGVRGVNGLGSGEFSDGRGDPIAGGRAIIETQQKLQERKDAQLRLEDNIKKSQEKGLELEQRKLEVAQKQLDVRKAELAVVKDQETNRRNARSAFQTLDPLGRQNLVEAVKLAQDRGIENVPQDVKEMLLSSPITANFARNQLPDPDQDPAFKELNQLLGGGLDLEPIQKRREELQQKIEEDTDKMEKSYANAITKVTEKFTSFLETITKAIAETETKFLSNQQKLQAQMKNLSE